MPYPDVQQFANIVMSSKKVAEVFEQIIEGTCRAVLKPGDDAIDGGANVGRHAVVMSQVLGPAGKVLAFEPIPEIVEKLRVRLGQANAGNVQIIQAALSDAPGKTTFNFVTNNPAYSGLQKRFYPFEPNIKVIDVDVVTMDSYLPQVSKLGLIKLDLEGGEYNALVGARKIMETLRPLVTFENGRKDSAEAHGYSLEEFFGYFDQVGYRVTDIFGRPFGPAEWDIVRYPWNFYAVAKESPVLGEILPGIVRQCVAAL